MDAALVPQRNVCEEHGEELDAAGELVVAPKPRMELGASVKDATVVLVLEPFKRHGRPLEVLQKGLELLALACGDAAVGVDSKPGVFPALEQRRGGRRGLETRSVPSS